MPNQRRSRQNRARHEQPRPDIASCARWLLREIVPFLRTSKRSRGRSGQHLVNAGIEVLEAIRAALDETIEWLREQRPAELRRIRIEE